jgi:hypothetical protein
VTRSGRETDGGGDGGGRPPGANYLAEHEDRLAWIMGSSRSGSTWLLRMLCEDARIVGIDDPHLGHHLGVWRPVPLAWATGRERPSPGTLDEVKREKPGYFFNDRYRDAWMPALRDLVRARFGAQLDDEAGDAQAPTVVVKEPGSQVARMLLSAFPDSRLIFLVRDGRDVVDSWLDAYQPDSWAIDEGAFPVAGDRRLALIEWLSAAWAYRTREVSRAYAAHPAERRATIRYERLLADPAIELARAFSAAGLDVDLSRIREIAAHNDYALVAPSDRGPRREVRRASPGGWRNSMSGTEQRAMHEIMGDELVACGYLPARPARVA